MDYYYSPAKEDESKKGGDECLYKAGRDVWTQRLNSIDSNVNLIHPTLLFLACLLAKKSFELYHGI
jgi:hypothetical protein